MTALHTSSLKSLPLIRRGKVRDIYGIGNDSLLIVQSDRISAFDVVLGEAIPGKGEVLTSMSHFWFDYFGAQIAHHLLEKKIADVVSDADDVQQVAHRCMVVKKLSPLPIEAVCRGYLIGSGWQDYQQTQSVCGINLPAGLRLGEQLATPIFTPATKAEQGAHDENISFARMAAIIGEEVATRVRDVSLSLYQQAAAYALTRGIIIADTKFEFALCDNDLVLIDEVLTPDSSRFWPADQWQVGHNPPSFDKQYVRDWLLSSRWDKHSTPPALPASVISETARKYEDIRRRLCH